MIVMEFIPYLLEDERFWWGLVGCCYFLLAVYSKASPSREYPDWFWLLYLVVSGAILFRTSAGYHFSESVTIYAEYLLLLVAVVFGLAFFAVMTVYAANRNDIDALLAEVRE
ncbi:hypothetical protein [Natrononativus amylolyticus]|uniref:hypothetical protein n=1 Tax=Natrononativus amylolyticus TaxID=2963434 RepID=UPI0020CFA3E3|nr:hypothetical protein [Natrononativus amylolyticus]